jgi:hypothetical protein
MSDGMASTGPRLHDYCGNALMARLQSGGSIMGGFEYVCWVLTILGTVIAAVLLAGALFASNGAPQEAAAAALAACPCRKLHY